jgi:hypothetical protein
LRQWHRCGKPTCRCARGELHGPYFYRFWREGGRLRKVYVRPDVLEEVIEQCQARRQQEQARRASWSRWRRTIRLLRQTEQITAEQRRFLLETMRPAWRR